MHAASRDSLAAASERLDAYLDRASAVDLGAIADALFAVVSLLDREPIMRRLLSNADSDPDSRVLLLDSLLAARLDPRTLDQLRGLVRSRWSAPVDLADAVEQIARQAALGVAERSGTMDEVEDELFRFGRIVEREQELRALLSDPLAPAERRIDLLDRLIDGKVNVATRRLLEQSVRDPRGRSLERTLAELERLASERRERYVAHVQISTSMSGEQESRLEAALSRIYGRPVSLRVELDRRLLGGLLVRVGDEVIDGTVLARLDRAWQRLAD